MRIPDSLPWGGQSAIARSIGVVPSLVSRWKDEDIPIERREAVAAAISEVTRPGWGYRRRNFLRHGEPNTDIPENISVAAVARRVGKPYSTVYNWFKYGTTDNKDVLYKAIAEELELYESEQASD